MEKFGYQRNLAGSRFTLNHINDISAGQWVSIALERDISTSDMKLFVDDSSTSVSGSFKNIPIALPGTIRVGHSQPSNISLTGRVTCFLIQDGKYQKSRFLTDIHDCNSSSWLTTAGNIYEHRHEKSCLRGPTQLQRLPMVLKFWI